MFKNIIVIGVSLGGLNSIPKILKGLTKAFPYPIILVQHVAKNTNQEFYCKSIGETNDLEINLAEDKMEIFPANLYVCPENYHLLVENTKHLALNIDEPQCCSRPSINLLFESAADIFADKCIGIILSGANNDGAKGIKAISNKGGLTIAQNPDNAESRIMLDAAIKTNCVHYIKSIDEINLFLKDKEKRL